MGEIGGKIIRLLSRAAIDLLLIFADLGREVGRHEAFNNEPPLIVFTQLLGFIRMFRPGFIPIPEVLDGSKLIEGGVQLLLLTLFLLLLLVLRPLDLHRHIFSQPVPTHRCDRAIVEDREVSMGPGGEDWGDWGDFEGRDARRPALRCKALHCWALRWEGANARSSTALIVYRCFDGGGRSAG